MIRFGLVQASAGPDVMENFNTVRHFVSEAKKAGCAALCFPEAFLTGYFPQETSELALSKEHPLFSQIASLARSQQMDLLIGFMEQEEDRFYLTHGIWNADGRVDLYRKTHLGQQEQSVFSSGDRLKVFSLSCGPCVGIQLCVETHFPEITQTYSLLGAEVIFAPHAVPVPAEKRREIWTKLIPARSYDNRVYMACCNLFDPFRFGGGCMATDPQGSIIASCFEAVPKLLCFDVDRNCVRAYHSPDPDRNHYYYPGRRRTELYLYET